MAKLNMVITFVLCALQGIAQNRTDYFNTVGTHREHKRIDITKNVDAEVKDSVALSLSCLTDSASINHPVFQDMSVEELEKLIAVYEQRILQKSSHLNSQNYKTYSYRDWKPRELNLNNLMDVVEEVGLSNKLFVLAQALLETGHFKSRVCNEYNNLFGLYDSKNRDYYHFARWEDSVVGYKQMIQYRYKGGNYLRFLKNIKYAEDPRYIRKVAELAKVLYSQYKCG